MNLLSSLLRRLPGTDLPEAADELTLGDAAALYDLTLRDVARACHVPDRKRVNPDEPIAPMMLHELGRRGFRKANRPFRRAFGGGEGRRRVLLEAGVAMAAERRQREAGLR